MPSRCRESPAGAAPPDIPAAYPRTPPRERWMSLRRLEGLRLRSRGSPFYGRADDGPRSRLLENTRPVPSALRSYDQIWIDPDRNGVGTPGGYHLHLDIV